MSTVSLQGPTSACPEGTYLPIQDTGTCSLLLSPSWALSPPEDKLGAPTGNTQFLGYSGKFSPSVLRVPWVSRASVPLLTVGEYYSCSYDVHASEV